MWEGEIGQCGKEGQTAKGGGLDSEWMGAGRYREGPDNELWQAGQPRKKAGRHGEEDWMAWRES